MSCNAYDWKIALNFRALPNSKQSCSELENWTPNIWRNHLQSKNHSLITVKELWQSGFKQFKMHQKVLTAIRNGRLPGRKSRWSYQVKILAMFSLYWTKNKLNNCNFSNIFLLFKPSLFWLKNSHINFSQMLMLFCICWPNLRVHTKFKQMLISLEAIAKTQAK